MRKAELIWVPVATLWPLTFDFILMLTSGGSSSLYMSTNQTALSCSHVMVIEPAGFGPNKVVNERTQEGGKFLKFSKFPKIGVFGRNLLGERLEGAAVERCGGRWKFLTATVWVTQTEFHTLSFQPGTGFWDGYLSARVNNPKLYSPADPAFLRFCNWPKKREKKKGGERNTRRR